VRVRRLAAIYLMFQPENILLSDSTDHAVLKLCDFGFAKLLKNPTDCLHTRCGSPGCVPSLHLPVPRSILFDLLSFSAT
jgi:serine/threonine protein kinase